MYFPVHALIFCRSIITFSLHLYVWPCGLRGRAVREQRGLAKPKVSDPSVLFFLITFIRLSCVFYFLLCLFAFLSPFVASCLIVSAVLPIVLGHPRSNYLRLHDFK